MAPFFFLPRGEPRGDSAKESVQFPSQYFPDSKRESLLEGFGSARYLWHSSLLPRCRQLFVGWSGRVFQDYPPLKKAPSVHSPKQQPRSEPRGGCTGFSARLFAAAKKGKLADGTEQLATLWALIFRNVRGKCKLETRVRANWYQFLLGSQKHMNRRCCVSSCE